MMYHLPSGFQPFFGHTFAWKNPEPAAQMCKTQTMHRANRDASTIHD
jgi:hypothetical protein